MIHSNRLFAITTIDDPLDLAVKLTEYSWTLCTGFSCQGLLFLNDSFSEDGAQEFAVILPDDEGHGYVSGHQVESIAFSWCTTDRALDHITDCTENARLWLDLGLSLGTVTVSVDPIPARHHCRLCA